MNTHRFTRALVLASCAFAQSCTLIADPNSYEFDDGCDLRMSLTEFAAHFSGPHPMAFFIVEPATESTEESTKSILVLDPTPSIDFTINVPNAIPDRRHEIRFYADQNLNGIVETVAGGVRVDHTWVLTTVCEPDPIPFEHTLVFQNFENPQPFGSNLIVNVSGIPETGGAFELRAIVRVPLDPSDPSETVERTVGAYHRPSRSNGTGGDMDPFTCVIPGILDEGVEYILEAWADGDGDGVFDRSADGTFEGTDDRHYRLEVSGSALLPAFAFDVTNPTIMGQTDHSGVVVVTPQP